MNQLWESFIVRALIAEEKDLFFRWMTETSSSINFNIDILGLITFYKENINVLNDENISLDGYVCF